MFLRPCHRKYHKQADDHFRVKPMPRPTGLLTRIYVCTLFENHSWTTCYDHRELYFYENVVLIFWSASQGSSWRRCIKICSVLHTLFVVDLNRYLHHVEIHCHHLHRLDLRDHRSRRSRWTIPASTSSVATAVPRYDLQYQCCECERRRSRPWVRAMRWYRIRRSEDLSIVVDLCQTIEILRSVFNFWSCCCCHASNTTSDCSRW